MLFSERLGDLDELVLRCRDVQSRQYIAEAVACYRAGAFRSCIVMTWIAVVFDFIHKLGELELTGDKAAAEKRSEYEDIRRVADVGRALKFEEKLLDLAKDQFEFISPIEYLDLQRLRGDRNRCAHPSMITYDEAYHPSAELARYHLRNTVIYLLQYPPVQGKAALERLIHDIKSPYFPTRHEDVLIQLLHGPLARPRLALVRNFTIVLLKTLLLDELDSSTLQRYLAALQAVQTLHTATVEQIFDTHLSVMLRQVDALRYAHAVQLLATIPSVQLFLQEDVIARLILYIQQPDASTNLSALLAALDIESLREAALVRVNSLSIELLRGLIATQPRPEFLDRALALYAEVMNYASANDQAISLILPLISFMGTQHLDRLLQIAINNSQVRGSNQFPVILQAIQSSGKIAESDFQDAIVRFVAQHPPNYANTWLSFLDEQHIRVLLEMFFTQSHHLRRYFISVCLNTLQQHTILPQPIVDELRAHYEGRYTDADG